MVHTLWKEAKTNKRFKTQGYYIMSIKIYMFRVSNMKMKPVFLNLLAYVSCYKKKKRVILSYYWRKYFYFWFISTSSF